MIVINKRETSDLGGVEVVLKQMLDALYPRQIVVLTYGNSRKTEIVEYRNVRTIRLGRQFPFSPVRISWKYKKALKELSKEHDTVFYHYPSFQPELYSNIFARKIVYYHADVTKFGILGKIYQVTAARRFLKDADIILVSSPNIISSSKTLSLYKEKCSVLPFGIDKEHFHYMENNHRSSLLKDGENKLLLFVGRMSRYKGFSQILGCLREIDPTYRLLVVSRDKYKAKDLGFINKNNLGGKITKVSDVGYEDLPEYYSSADILLMPSTDRAEAFGSVAVEAMACSVPVISTELGTGTSYHNIDGVTGRVIKSGSVTELTAAVKEIVESELDKNRIRARAEEFSLSNFNERITSVIKESEEH